VGGSSYISTQAANTSTPGGTGWSLLAQAGAAGPNCSATSQAGTCDLGTAALKAGTVAATTPIAASSGGTGASTAQGAAINQATAAGGYVPVASIVNDSSTDNTSALQAAINGYLPMLLPNNCQGNLGRINVAGPLVYGSTPAVTQAISGSGWSEDCATSLAFTGTSYATGAIVLSGTALNAQGQEFSNLSIQAAPGNTITGGAAIYSNPGIANYLFLDRVNISGFPQALNLINIGNSTIQRLTIAGTAASVGSSLVTITGQGANSNHIWSAQSSCGTHEFTAVPGVTFFSFGTPTAGTAGVGNEFHFNDSGLGCSTVAYQNGGAATYFFANTEARLGPILNLASGTAIIDSWTGEQTGMSNLGPAFIAGLNSHLSMNSLTGLTEIPTPMTITQTATGGSYAAGTQFFWYEAIGTYNAGSAIVNLNSGPALSAVVFGSGSTNEAVLSFPSNNGVNQYAITNASSYNIWRNTVNNSATAVLIASGVTGASYTSTGSETTTATPPPDGNVPLILQGPNALVTATCSNGRSAVAFPYSNFNYSKMAMDSYGRYFNPCVAPEIPLTSWPMIAGAENVGACYQVLPAPGVAGQDALYCNQATTANGATSYQWINEWANSGTIAYTSGTNIYTTNSPQPSLITMNCASTCSLYFNAQPSTSWCTNVMSIGSTLATIAFHTPLTFNGQTTAPVLTPFRTLRICANSSVSTDFEGDAPFTQGANISFTPTAGGVAINAAASAPVRVAYAGCNGIATSSSTLVMGASGLGGGTTACTTALSGTNRSGLLMPSAGTLSNLTVRCGGTGVNSSSGVFTIFDTPAGTSAGSGTATPITVTYGTSAAESVVQDTTHTYNYAMGDYIVVRFTTQASETLGSCMVSFNY